MPRSCSALLAMLALAAPATAATITLDFEGFTHGQVVTATGGYTVTADNASRSFDIAAAFDTTRSGTADADLEQGAGWSTGNLAPQTLLGNALILQENDTGCGSGVCSNPDDEGRRPAGSFRFDPVPNGVTPVFQHFAFDLLDVDSATLENGSITFHLGVDDVVSFAFSDFLGLGQGVTYGNHSANRVLLNHIGDFDSFTIVLAGSGAIDNLVLSDAVIVPEPATAALLALGLAGLGARRARRR